MTTKSKMTPVNSDVNTSLMSTLQSLLVAKISEDSRISKILGKLETRYSHLDSVDFERSILPILCLEPSLLYKLLRECNNRCRGLSMESGLSHFKSSLSRILVDALVQATEPEQLSLNSLNEYSSLLFGRLAGSRKKVEIDNDVIASLESASSKAIPSSDSTNENNNSLPLHLKRSVDSGVAYLMAALAISPSNNEFHAKIGLDVIKSSYTSIKLSNNFPELSSFDARLSARRLPVQSLIVRRILDESLLRYLKGSRLREESLCELNEYTSQIIELGNANTRISHLQKSVESLRSDISLADSDKNNLVSELTSLKSQHEQQLLHLKAQLLSKERGGAVGIADLSQKIRSQLMDSRPRLESEIKKLELLLQAYSSNNNSSELRLLARLRTSISDLESKLMEILS